MSSRPGSHAVLDRFLGNRLPGQLLYSEKFTSFSPLFSNCGLTFDAGVGIASLWLHYNRNSAELGPDFLRVEDGWKPDRRGGGQWMDRVEQPLRKGNASAGLNIRFSGRDCFQVEVNRLPGEGGEPLAVWLNPLHPLGKIHGIRRRGSRRLSLSIEVPLTDPRDPDWSYVVGLEIEVSAGHLEAVPRPAFAAKPTVNRREHTWFRWSISEGDASATFRVALPGIASARPSAPCSTGDWWRKKLAGLEGVGSTATEKEAALAAGAILLSNAAQAPGRLRGAVACFPSRGRYPTHYFWDSFFHNVAFNGWRPELALDGMRLLMRNLEQDGKVPQFICPTWNRPGSTQTPLLGWGVGMLLDRGAPRPFVEESAEALRANTTWWLKARVRNPHGVIDCDDPFEVWDDTPRLDDGPIEIIDHTVFVAVQMSTLARCLRLLGDAAGAKRWEKRRADLVSRLISRFYCAEQELFLDRDRETGRFVRVRTPASFLPFLLRELAGTPRALASIRCHLLSPQAFFGTVPFPCVAYDDPAFRADAWWRGPVWPPLAWFMLQVLRRNGLVSEADAAREKILRVMLRDGSFHELFDAASGAGLGALQQGWTAAVFIDLLRRDSLLLDGI